MLADVAPDPRLLTSALIRSHTPARPETCLVFGFQSDADKRHRGRETAIGRVRFQLLRTIDDRQQGVPSNCLNVDGPRIQTAFRAHLKPPVTYSEGLIDPCSQLSPGQACSCEGATQVAEQ